MMYDIVKFSISYKNKTCWKASHNQWLTLSMETLLNIGEIWKHIKPIRARIVARILMLSNMRNDLMFHFEKHCSTLALWDAVKVQYGGTLTTRLRCL